MQKTVDKATEKPADDARQAEAFYKSQTEIDAAIGRRIARERAKWERDNADILELSRLAADYFAGGDVSGAITLLSEGAQPLKSAVEPPGPEPEASGQAPIQADTVEPEVNEPIDPARLRDISMQQIYNALHPDEYAREIEQRVLENIRARANQPLPLQTGVQQGGRINVAALSDDEIRRIDERVRHGERITF